jgi:hypothetical protein
MVSEVRRADKSGEAVSSHKSIKKDAAKVAFNDSVLRFEKLRSETQGAGFLECGGSTPP